MIAFRKNLGWLVVLATMVTSLMCSMALASPFKTEIFAECNHEYASKQFSV